MTRLPRILSTCLLLAGAIAWLLGPGAPAQPRGAIGTAGGPAQPWGAEEVWLEGPTQDPDVPQPQRAVAAPSKPAMAPWEALQEPAEPTPAEPLEPAFEAPEPALEEEPVHERPAPPDADRALDLVRRMLAVHARMAEP